MFQVDQIVDFIPFVHAFCQDNINQNRKLIYFRFAEHGSLVPDNIKAEIFKVHPEEGFEHFIDEIFTVIERFGRGAAYVFDSLSDLAVDWYSDRMVANFFMLTCPYLFDFETETFFALLRNRHSEYTILKIHATAQIIIDVYNKQEKHYIHPLKVWKRHSNTMYMLHMWNDGEFIPVSKSSEISEILTEYAQSRVDFTTRIQDIWSKTFAQLYDHLQNLNAEKCDAEDLKSFKEKIIRMVITRDPDLLPISVKYLDLEDLFNVGRRMIGTGLIGGKSVGMLLAQSILRKTNSKWKELLEKHDSFFIGSDVFYTYLVNNNCWWLRYQIRKSEDFLELASKARTTIEKGKFSEEIIEQFKSMLNYYGQSPIIVRSSSLLEDAYGNSFSGKYESVYLANQGTPEERLENFLEAIRRVYQSTLSDQALLYRVRRNLLDKDEQMAILVQRVSGASYGDLFYPQLAGVGYSFNPFVWSNDIKPEAGLVRLVFGLGTRAVERIDDDYTRIVALSSPQKRPESSLSDKLRYNQRKVDILNLKKNAFHTIYFDDVVNNSTNLQIEFFGSRDFNSEDVLRKIGKEKPYYYLDLDKKVLKTSIVNNLQEILQTLAKVYDYPVDIEFTINFFEENRYKIYVLQCRPLQIKGETERVEEPKDVQTENILMRSNGPIIGHGVFKTVDYLIYIIPDLYSKLSTHERNDVARLIGKLNQILSITQEEVVFLAGPGRWATTDPSLGVPVTFQEINKVTIICEIAEMHENLCPDVSLGTHFFNELVESDMLYIALSPKEQNSILNKEKISNMRNTLRDLLPEATKYENLVRVIKNAENNSVLNLKIYANPVKQYAILFIN